MPRFRQEVRYGNAGIGWAVMQASAAPYRTASVINLVRQAPVIAKYVLVTRWVRLQSVRLSLSVAQIMGKANPPYYFIAKRLTAQ